MLDEAKRWFEVSTVICRFVPGGKERAQKVSSRAHLSPPSTNHHHCTLVLCQQSAPPLFHFSSADANPMGFTGIILFDVPELHIQISVAIFPDVRRRTMNGLLTHAIIGRFYLIQISETYMQLLARCASRPAA